MPSRGLFSVTTGYGQAVVSTVPRSAAAIAGETAATYMLGRHAERRAATA